MKAYVTKKACDWKSWSAKTGDRFTEEQLRVLTPEVIAHLIAEKCLEVESEPPEVPNPSVA
jgi:hypothetical protein